MRKRILWIALLCLSLILLAGCGGSSDKGANNPPPEAPEKSAAPEKSEPKQEKSSSSGMSPAIAEIYEKAKQEGKLVWWTPDDLEVEPIVKAFEAKYPGIKVEAFEVKPSDAITRIITEANAGQTNVDVFDLYLPDVPLLKERGLVLQTDWSKIFGIDPRLVASDNSGMLGWNNAQNIAYNTSLVKPEDVPKTWEDLLDPKWKGKIIVESRGNPFPILAYSWGAEKTLDYVTKLMAQKPIITKGGTPTSQAIANGQGAIAVGTYSFKVDQQKAQGAPVDYVKTGDIPCITHGNGVLKNAPHLNAGTLFAHFVSSEEGLKARASVLGGGRLVPGAEGTNLTELGRALDQYKPNLIIQDEKHPELENEVAEQVAKIIAGTK